MLTASWVIISRTVSLPEVIWTAVAVVGFYLFQRLFRRSVNDRKALRARVVNGIREYAAMTTMLLYGTIMVVMFSHVLIGVIVMMLPTPNNTIRPSTWVTATVFIIADMGFAVVGYVVERRREELVRRIAEVEEGI